VTDPSALEAITGPGGAEALPRRNGELVFEAPWESRAFGVAVALHDAGAMDFERFRAHLIAEIGEHGDDEDGGGYYEHWLDALQHALLEQGVVSAAELDARVDAIAHEWAHDHDHGA
jgi:nitrile hydratase accessory protein